MRKGIFRNLVLVLAIGLVNGFCILPCFAEEITITTYYPSPYGNYNELQTNKLAAGDTNNDGQLTDADQPNRNGDIRIKPQPGDPASWPIGAEGQLTYSQTNDELYHSNGSEWVAQGGGGGVCYTNYGQNSCYTGYTRVIDGYTTIYWVLYTSGSAMPGELVCSPILHDTQVFNANYGGTSTNGTMKILANEPCAICCK